jgi:hypothetical protein
MAAGVYPLEVEQGATKSFPVALKDSLNQPINLTGYSGRGQIRLKASDSAAIASFVVTITNAALGEVSVVLPATALVGVKLSGSKHSEKTVAVYDIELYKPGDPTDVIRLLNGSCSISPEVTK